jgi:hypothetical protein
MTYYNNVKLIHNFHRLCCKQECPSINVKKVFLVSNVGAIQARAFFLPNFSGRLKEADP